MLANIIIKDKFVFNYFSDRMFSENKKWITAALLIVTFLCYSFYLYLSLADDEGKGMVNSTEGKMLWQQHNCNACHQVYGLGGYLGPDLTNVYSIKGPAYIRAFLQNGTVIMPNFQLTEQETVALLAFLQDIDASGKSDPRTFIINNNGTIHQ